MPILKEALETTSFSRPKDYKHPLDDFTCTASIWAAIIKIRYGVDIPLTAEFVGLMMAAMKVSREAGNHKHDNLVDIAGYAECIDKVISERKARAASEL